MSTSLFALSWTNDDEALEVRTKKRSGNVRNSPVSASVLRPEQGDAPMSAAAIASQAPGVRMKQSGNGDEIMIRGAGSNQTPVYIDGVLLSSWSLLMLRGDELDLVEIYRGFTPAEFSTPGIGGALNFVTKKAAKNSTEAGHTATVTGYETFLRTSAAYESVTNAFTLYQQHDNGEFEYLNDNGTPVVNTADDFSEKRKNNAVSRLSLADTVSYNRGNLRSWLALSGSVAQRGVPGLAAAQVLHVKKNLSALSTQVGLELSGKSLSSKSRVTLRNEISAAKDPGLELLSVNNDERRFTAFEAMQNLTFTGKPFRVAVSVTFQNECYGKNERLADTRWRYPRQQRQIYHGATDVHVDLFADRLTFLAQLRSSCERSNFYDEYRWFTSKELKRDEELSPVFGGHGALLYRVVPYAFNLKCGAGRSYRMADPSEVYGSAAYVQGNTSLKPEYVDRIEGGFEYFSRNDNLDLYFNAVAFYSKAYDVILFIQNTQRTLKAYNISQAKIHGAEISAEIEYLHFAAAGANYTWQNARDDGAIEYYRNKLLPHRPEHEAALYVKVFSGWWQFRYTADIVSYYFLDRANTRANYREPSLTHSADALVVSGDLSLSAGCRNIFDVRRRDAVGYPLPGRTFHVSAVYRF